VTEREKKGERRGIIIVRLVKKGNANREEEEEGKKKKDNLGRSEGDETLGGKSHFRRSGLGREEGACLPSGRPEGEKFPTPRAMFHPRRRETRGG
jgi:hypothetical protein